MSAMTALQNELDELRKTVATLAERAAQEGQAVRDEMSQMRESIYEVDVKRKADKKQLLDDIKLQKGTDKHLSNVIKDVGEGLMALNERVTNLEVADRTALTQAQKRTAQKPSDGRIKELAKNATQSLRDELRRVDAKVDAQGHTLANQDGRLANIEARLANIERVLNIGYFNPTLPAVDGGYGGFGYMGGPGAAHPGYMGNGGRF